VPAATRIGDPYSDGDTQAVGSGNVFVNGIPFSRLGDPTTGHGCWSPANVNIGSPNVFANSIKVSRVGDTHTVHCCPHRGCHDGVFTSGSGDVYVNQGFPGAQPEITFEDAVMRLDDEELDVVPPSEQRASRQRAAYIQAFGPNFQFEQMPPREQISTTPERPVGEIPTDCMDIYAHVGIFPGTFQISPHFKLSQLTTNTVVSNYLLQAQGGLSEADIVCNLRKLCTNVLEVLLNRYGNIQINSGFRHVGNGASNSQHFKGQAADITFTDITTADQFNQRAQEVKQMGIYDQFIFEQNRPTKASTWFHLSYTEPKRVAVLTKKAFSNTYFPGLYALVFS